MVSHHQKAEQQGTEQNTNHHRIIARYLSCARQNIFLEFTTSIILSLLGISKYSVSAKNNP